MIMPKYLTSFLSFILESATIGWLMHAVFLGVVKNMISVLDEFRVKWFDRKKNFLGFQDRFVNSQMQNQVLDSLSISNSHRGFG